ncbi:lysophospholipid acyltransferase family protein [Lichenicola sp.]|uniref:lysophospholipid acyltransferase family protein n=1 Tax=Lichenicola sp. TaxID=2804529 RepID=UPI003AFFAA90
MRNSHHRSPPASPQEWIVGVALRGVIAGLRRIGPVAASNLGGWIGRTIGPLLPVSRVADRNLVQAFPDMEATARRRIIRAVWDNLGRNAAELPHLASFVRTTSGPGWEIEGEHHLAALVGGGTRALFFSGHFGNWEMILPIAGGLGLRVSGFYRAASNRTVDRIIQGLRTDAMPPGVSMFAKGAPGARAALAHLQQGGSLGLLVDQKMNDGIAVPFFGRDAMTAPALAQFALRFRAPIMPVHVVRLGPARFRMICEPPLDVALTGDRATDTRSIATAMNRRLEDWIRAEPASWLWLHRRWPKPA